MNSVIKLGERRPLLVAGCIVVAYAAVFLAPAAFSSASFGRGQTESDVASVASQLRIEFILAASVVALVVLLGWSRAARLTTPVNLRALRWVLGPLVFTAFLGAVFFAGAAEAGALPSGGALASLFLTVALIGLFEEVLFRGVLFHGIEAAAGAMKALIISSVVFGLMHYLNWVGGQPFGDTTQQVLHAMGGGFLYGALMLLTGSIWPSVFLHALWDASVSFASIPTDDGDAGTGDAVSIPVETDALSVVATTADGGVADVAVFLTQAVIAGFEPVYGLVVLFAYLAHRARRPAMKGGNP